MRQASHYPQPLPILHRCLWLEVVLSFTVVVDNTGGQLTKSETGFVDICFDTAQVQYSDSNKCSTSGSKIDTENFPDVDSTGKFSISVTVSSFTIGPNDGYLGIEVRGGSVAQSEGDTTESFTAYTSPQHVTITSPASNQLDFTMTDQGGRASYRFKATVGGEPAGNNYNCTWSSDNGLDLSKANGCDFIQAVNSTKIYNISVTATPKSGGPALGPTTHTLHSSDVEQAAALKRTDSCANSGNSITCVVNLVVTGIAGVITELVVNLSYVITTPIIQTVLAIQPHEAAFANVILQGWVVIRNLANILFILALIVVGFGTILRLDRYNYKSLLTTIVIMALLVNFSLAIAQGILGVADTMQAQFLPQNSQVINRLSYDLIYGPNKNLLNSAKNGTGSFSTSVSALIYTLLPLLRLLSCWLCVMLIRVALWLLLLASPIAYAGFAFPWARNFGSMWWREFFRYAFFTPLIALALNLCAFLANNNATYIGSRSKITFPTAPFPNFASNIADILTALIVMGCLTASLSIANKMGIKGASTSNQMG